MFGCVRATANRKQTGRSEGKGGGERNQGERERGLTGRKLGGEAVRLGPFEGGWGEGGG